MEFDFKQLDELCSRLSEMANGLNSVDCWPDEQLRLCAQYDVFRWFVGEEFGGFGLSADQIVAGYLKLAEACLTTTFVITQRTGACNRIAVSDDAELRGKLMPALADGSILATLGISHLTTSHRHQGKPVLTATRKDNSKWELNGFSPWVTGGRHANQIVLGAEAEEGEQLLIAMPTDLPGIKICDAVSTIALSASQTGKVEFHAVEVNEEMVLDGPRPNVLKTEKNSATGGLQTSTLAIGLSTAAVRYVVKQSASRLNLVANAKALEAELSELESKLLQLANGDSCCTNEELRTAANSFVLRSTQSALVAAKGAGFVDGHPAGRWCREALFFLVWSCPQGVSDANLCEFAGIAD